MEKKGRSLFKVNESNWEYFQATADIRSAEIVEHNLKSTGAVLSPTKYIPTESKGRVIVIHGFLDKKTKTNQLLDQMCENDIVFFSANTNIEGLEQHLNGAIDLPLIFPTKTNPQVVGEIRIMRKWFN